MPLNPPPVIPNTLKAVLRWGPGNSVAVINRLHFHSATVDVAGLDTFLNSNLTSGMFDCMSNVRTLNSYGITPLDGTTAEQEFPGPGIHGSGSGQDSPASAGVVSLRTATRGPRGRGRVYLGPVTEDNMSNGSLSDRTTVQSAWDTFLAAAAAASFPVVVASYKHLDTHTVLHALVDNELGTQRRRQSKLSH